MLNYKYRLKQWNFKFYFILNWGYILQWKCISDKEKSWDKTDNLTQDQKA